MADKKFKITGRSDVDARHRIRNETERIVCVLNPRARGGSAGAMVDEVRRAVDRIFSRAEVVVTRGPGHATELAREAVEGGADIVAALGGGGPPGAGGPGPATRWSTASSTGSFRADAR